MNCLSLYLSLLFGRCCCCSPSKATMIVYRNMMFYCVLSFILCAFVVVATTTATQDTHSCYYSPLHRLMSRRGGGARDDTTTTPATCHRKKLVVVGSANADCFLSVERLPVEGENLMCIDEPIVDVPGGKGLTQAIAAAKLVQQTPSASLPSSSATSSTSASVSFVGQFGNDQVATDVLQKVLQIHGVELSQAGEQSTSVPSGRGYVFLSSSTGQVSAVVSGGSNQRGWEPTWPKAWQRCHGQQRSSKDDDDNDDNKDDSFAEVDALNSAIDELLNNCSLIMLQREVPEYVNRFISCKAKEHINNRDDGRGREIIILQDVGGEDRSIDTEHLQNCDYLMPNESELRRLVASLENHGPSSQNVEKDYDVNDDDDVVALCHILQKHGARNVLVTRGSRGSTLVSQDGKNVIHQPPIPCDGNRVVDETGAGDCYRAAFAVALLEHGVSLHNEQKKRHKVTSSDSWILGHRQCMEFASAAGSLAVEKMGAVPSTPTREQVEERLRLWKDSVAIGSVSKKSVLEIPRGDGQRKRDDGGDVDHFPFLIGSRLNSMKDRSELWDGPLTGPLDYVKRQAVIQGLTCVDFNYPQHFDTTRMAESIADAKRTLDDANLVAGAVCLRYPVQFARGAMNHPDAALRREAIELTKQAAQAALNLGCREVVVWSAFDGYDYPFQVDYDAAWAELVNAFQECCDSFPSIKFSVEFKPTDENTRFFTIPSTGAALLMVDEVDRENFGLTLDVGHMLMAGENPGQSIAMVGRHHAKKGSSMMNKLFGIQLNDGYTRLAAEDGLMFGSIHPGMALEIMYQLRKIGFDGHFYFDTFPQRTDPIKEAEYNIRRVKALWTAACNLYESGRLKQIMHDHDAVAALELVNEFLRSSY